MFIVNRIPGNFEKAAKNLTKIRFVVTATVSALLLGACSGAISPQQEPGEWPEKLVLAGGTLLPDTDAQQTYALLIEVLEEELGIPIEFYAATDRAAISEGIAAHRVDIASLDPFGYVLATGISNDVQIISALVRAPDALPGYNSLGVARADDVSMQGLADARGKKVCYLEASSAGGYLFPALGLKAAGLDPVAETTKDIEPIFTGFLGIQPAVNVANGDCDLGFLPDAQYERALPASGLVEEGALKVIWESEVIPAYTLTVNRKLPKDLIAKITEIVIAKGNKSYMVESGRCSSEEDCPFLSLSQWGYVSEVDETYNQVREACAVIGIRQCEKK